MYFDPKIVDDKQCTAPGAPCARSAPADLRLSRHHRSAALPLRARGEFEEVGRKPLGDGFVGVPVQELRGALIRPFWNGRLDAGVNFLIAKGYSGQTSEVLALPGEPPGETIAGVRIPSYAGTSLTFHF